LSGGADNVDPAASLGGPMSVQPISRRLHHLMQIYPEIIASTPDGCYLGVMDSVRQGGDGRLAISFLIQRTLTHRSELV